MMQIFPRYNLIIRMNFYNIAYSKDVTRYSYKLNSMMTSISEIISRSKVT